MNQPKMARYRIIERLGAGGMGEVFLAEDLRLGRRVALKFLPAALALDARARARFEREARAASALDHPNICAVFDLEDADDGRMMLAMAYCEGETLKARREREGRLPVDEAIDLAAQIADGLAEAHAKGVVHRDIKPANVMLTRSGRLKIVDFGVARLAEATQAAVTSPGVVVGTPSYMAPEQIRGDGVDGRADLWSLGVILYEMLAGVAPFRGDSVFAVFHNILNEAPAPVEQLRPEVSASLAAVVGRALAKAANQRYQRAEELASALRGGSNGWRDGTLRAPEQTTVPNRASGTAARDASTMATMAPTRAGDAAVVSVRLTGTARVPSIAVLPFVNLSGDGEQEYFCDGIAEELITALGALDGLRVTSFTSSRRFKGQALDIRQIGAQLNVETVLEGTLRKAGNRVRLAAQLISIADGFHLWSERYDRDLDDVFAVQDEIARAIVEKLKVRLLGGAGQPIVRAGTVDREAHERYLQGRHHFARRHRGSVEKAVECFQQAIALDPSFAAAYAGLADCYAIMGLYGNRPGRELLAGARALVERARALDDTLPEVHHAIGIVRLYLDWVWPELETAFTRAIDLNPGLAYTRGCFAVALGVIGDRGRAEAEAERALSLDPLSPLVHAIAAAAHSALGGPTRAVELSRRALELEPDFAPSLVGLSQDLGTLGRHDEAIAAARRAVELSERHPHFLSALGCALARAQVRDEAAGVLEEIGELARARYVSPIETISVLAASDRREEALAALEQAARDRLPPYPFYFAIPAYDGLRGDPRFAAILAAYNYREDWLRRSVTA